MDINTIALLAQGAAMIFFMWRTGANKASGEVINTYKERVVQLSQQVANLTSELGRLNGILQEKDERMKVLEAIATNRNPELEAFMKYMIKVGGDAGQYMLWAKNTNTDIQKLVNEMNTKFDKQISVLNRKPKVVRKK